MTPDRSQASTRVRDMLYPDQSEQFDRLIAAYRDGGHRAVILEMPTGTGKTVMAMAMLEAMRGRMLFLVHRVELAEQFVRTCTEHGFGDDVGVIRAGEHEQPWKRHQVAMVQTLARRLDSTRIRPTLIVTDECHHARAATWERIYAHWPDVHMLGLSATPERLDGKGLRPPYQHLVRSPGTAWYMRERRLAPYELFVLPTGIGEDPARVTGGDYNAGDLERELTLGGRRSKLQARVLPKILEYGRGRRWIAYLPAIASSRKLAADLRDAGVRARHIDGTTPADERKRILRSFAAGDLDGMCNVNLFDEGLNVPECDAVFLCRRTRSVTRYRQSCGRAFRFLPGKTALIADLAGVFQDLGLMKPSDAVEWNLDGRKARQAAATEKPAWVICAHCQRVIRSGQRVCPYCGHERALSRPEIREADMELVRVEIEDIAREAEASMGESGRVDMLTLADTSERVFDRHGEDGLRLMGERLRYDARWADMRARELRKFRQGPGRGGGR